MTRVFAASSLLFLVTACASAPPAPAPAPASSNAPTAPPPVAPVQAAADTPVELRPGVSVTQPAGFFLEKRDGALAFHDPDNAFTVWALALDDSDAEKAVRVAWERVRPGFAREVQETTTPPPRDGWDEVVQVDYKASAEESRVVFALARRKGPTSYVMLVDAPLASLDKRGAQFGQLLMSLKAPGAEAESFADKPMKPLTPERIEQLFAFVDEARIALGVPGTSIAIVAEGKLAATKAFGVLEAGKPEPVTSKTLFMIGSTTKPFTTLLEASLVDEGKLTWDKPLVEILPEFSLADKELTKKVLLKHTACACTGMPRRDFDFLFDFEKVTPADRLAQMSTMAPTTGFGETFQYSNWMVGIGGFAAARAAHPTLELGAAYDKAMQERIFAPLGMTSSTLDFEKAAKSEHAKPHADALDGSRRTLRLFDERGVYAMRPAGGVWSTPTDMAKYMAAELSKGVLPNGTRLVSEEALLERRVPRTKIIDGLSYGLGFFVETVNGLTVVHHGGNNLGYTSDFWFIPELGVGVSILSNLGGANSFHSVVKRRMLETLFDGRDEAKGRLAFVVAERTRGIAQHAKDIAALDDAFAAKLVGRYRDPYLGEIVLRRDGADVILDAGEWKSALRRNIADAGGNVVELFDAPFAGLPLILGGEPGKRTVTLDVGQQKYVFTEVAPAKGK
jgi:CubicO group peptidase (beta-lactamase class C family)